jgi:hypothetical protein
MGESLQVSGIIALDPGKLTGYAILVDNKLNRGQLPYLDALDYAASLLSRRVVDVAVIEDFLISERTIRVTRGEMWSLRSIGAVQWFCHRMNAEFVLQIPGDAKEFCPNERLKALGWHFPGRPHANDAMRHLLLYLARNNRYDGQFVDGITQDVHGP